MNPIAKPCRIEPRNCSPPKKPPSSLFSPPQPADVRQLPPDLHLPNGSCQAQQAGVWRRSHADNQKLYDVSRPCLALVSGVPPLWLVVAVGQDTTT